VAKYLWERGWAERNAGNISADITELVSQEKVNLDCFPKRPLKISQVELANRCFLTTPTGSRFRDFAQKPEKNLLIIGVANKLDGYHLLFGGEKTEIKPTSEFPTHLKIHGFLRKNNLPQKVVLHTHPNHLIALTHITRYNNEGALNHLLWSMHPEAKICIAKGVGLVPYHRPGSEELADATIKALKNHRIVLWEKHGCVAIGKDVFEAFDLIDAMNKAAEIFFLCRNAGYEPEGLSDEQLAELKLAS
jgi:rhamnulose-1-phosphate aldolase